MSAESVFRCPVCRAAQPPQELCRRCQADLSLVLRARRRLAYVQEQRELALARGDDEREAQFAVELRWIAPLAVR